MAEERNNQSISRRAVVKGVTWSVPVVAVAFATPLLAASIVGGDQVDR